MAGLYGGFAHVYSECTVVTGRMLAHRFNQEGRKVRLDDVSTKLYRPYSSSISVWARD